MINEDIEVTDEDIEMMDLSWMTKWSIRRRVRIDLANKGISRSVYAEDGSNPDPDQPNLPVTFDSAYISEQFRKYSNYKDTQLFPKRHRYWLYNDRMEQQKKRDTLRAAVAEIQSQISAIRLDLANITTAEQTKMHNLELEQRKYELSREFHMVQMCVNHAVKLREDFNKLTLPKKKAIHALYAQLIKLLENEKTASIKKRGKIYSRIRYYCDYACRQNTGLGAEYIKDDVMALMGDTDPLGDLGPILEDALLQRDFHQLADADESGDDET